MDRGAFSNENTPKIHLASILCPVESAFLLTIVSITSIMMLLFQLSPLLCAVLCLVAQSCLTLWDPMDCSPPVSSVHRDSPGKNTAVGCHALLQGIFPTLGLLRLGDRVAGGFFTAEPLGKPIRHLFNEKNTQNC